MSALATQKKKKEVWLHMGLLVVAILVAYSKIFHAGFMEWDDREYVVHNRDIMALGIQNVTAWFSRFYVGNYQPLTMLSYAVDFVMGGVQPLGYHLTNILLHTCNAILLYFFVSRIQTSKQVAFFTALLFALHPCQTETVSWIAERKTLLCVFFYLLALLRYTRYLKAPSARNMAIVCLLAIAALMSKALAVALPVALLPVDVWLQRDMKSKIVWLEKIPLLLISLVVGIVAIKGQEAGHFLNVHEGQNLFSTIIFAAYAYLQYIVHFFVPVHLSVIYPYPAEVGFIEYLYLVIAAGIIALAFISYRRKWYILCGGILFYTANIVLLLQFIQFGEVLTADRYVYIACIGILVPVVYYLYLWLEKRFKQVVALVSFGVVAASLLVMTFLRNEIWLSDINFYTSIVDVFPNSAVAQYSVGGLYMRMGNYAEAEQHINLATALAPGNYNAWYNKGVLYLREGKPMESLDALNRCLAINEYPKALFSRAMLYQGTGKPALALADIEKVLAQQPENARAYYIKADCLEQRGNVAAAIDNYSKAIAYEDNEPLFYIRRGLAYCKASQNGAGLNDLNTAVGLNPASGEALYYRGIIKYRSAQSPCEDFRNALRYGYRQAGEAIAQFCK